MHQTQEEVEEYQVLLLEAFLWLAEKKGALALERLDIQVLAEAASN